MQTWGAWMCACWVLVMVVEVEVEMALGNLAREKEAGRLGYPITQGMRLITCLKPSITFYQSLAWSDT